MDIDRPVIMIGMPRSGTSIISETFSLHKDLGWFSNYVHRAPRFPLLAMYDRLSFMPSVGWRLRGKKQQDNSIQALIRRFLPYPGDGYKLWRLLCGDDFVWSHMHNAVADKQTRDRTRAYVRSILSCQGKKRLFTKINGPGRISFLSSIFPGACFIHVIRDPRATVSSLLKIDFWKKGNGQGQPWWSGLPGEHIQEWTLTGKLPCALASVQWKYITETIWEEAERLPANRVINIRYEDFVEDQRRVINNMFRILGFSKSAEADKYLASIGSAKNMNHKYKNNLTRTDIRVIENITRSTARRAGYSF